MLYPLVLLFASLPALTSLFPSGFFQSHDGAFHLVRLIHFYTELTRGQFPVRLATDLAFGYGYPIFNFFYPLPYYLGSLIHLLGFDFTSSLKIVMGLSLILSVFFAYLFLRCHFGRFASFVGAFLYLYFPFRFLSFYVSGALGIVLSLTFVPLIFYALSRRRYLLFSLAFSFLITSHNVSALIFTPIFIAYHFVFIKKVTPFILSSLLGLGLSAYFLIPAFHDLGSVRLSRGVAADYSEHFPALAQLIYSPWGYGYSRSDTLDGESFQIGFAQMSALLLSLLVIIFSLFRRRFYPLSSLFLLISLLVVFLMLRSSDFVWRLVPLMPQIQFPWRLLAVLGFTASFLSAWLVSFITVNYQKILLGFFFVFLAAANNRHYLRPFSPERFSDQAYLRDFSLLYGSTDIAWENRPVAVDFIPSFFPDSPLTPADIITSVSSQNPLSLTLNNPVNQTVVVNRFYTQNWSLWLNSAPLNFSPDPHGLIQFDLPPGESQLLLRYRSTPVQTLANLTTLISFLILFYQLVYPRLFPRNQHMQLLS